ncbi:MAG TPA: hypothetical protein VJP40_06720, partial [bacterium]|nr:hypothetical protein [bacterium]
MKDTVCQIAYQVALQEGYFRIGLKTGWSGFVPGQFGMLEVPREDGVLLRRPFSFARQIGDLTEILYKKVGKGTTALARMAPGQEIRLLGPLGKGFSSESPGGDYVGVAGGYGIAPFLELAEQLRRNHRSLTLFYGARSVKDLLYLQELKALGVKLHLTTVDGSAGETGLVTEAVGRVYSAQKPGLVACCGPTGLLKAVQQWALPRGIACELSVEET